MDLGGLRRYFRKDSPRWVILIIDLLIVLFSYYLTNFVIGSFKGSFEIGLMVKKSIFVVSVYCLSFLYFKTYRGIVRQTGFRDAMRLFLAVFAASATLVVVSSLVRISNDPESL